MVGYEIRVGNQWCIRYCSALQGFGFLVWVNGLGGTLLTDRMGREKYVVKF